MNKHKSNKIKENSNTVRHFIMGQIITTQNLVAIKEVRHAGQWFHTRMICNAYDFIRVWFVTRMICNVYDFIRVWFATRMVLNTYTFWRELICTREFRYVYLFSYYGWPKWTKSAKGSTYEKFHVRKHTRIKSFVHKTIRVSKVLCIKWYAYQKFRV